MKLFKFKAKARLKRWLVLREKREKIEEIQRVGRDIINRPAFNEKTKLLLHKAVKVTIRKLRRSGFDADEIIIWTSSLCNFQLKCLLEDAYKDVPDSDELVRALIKLCHLEAVRLYPDLKEY